MKYFKFDQLINEVNALDFAKTHLGMTPTNSTSDHFNTPWRAGSDSGALVIFDKGFKDHVSSESGNIIKLVELVKEMDVQSAQCFIGESVGITEFNTPSDRPETGRTQILVEQGWKITGRYDYKDINGKLIHYTLRLEKGTEKEFTQSSASNRTLKTSGVETILYNAMAVSRSQEVFVCEGEKDAESIMSLGLTGTTNASGALKWTDEYSNTLRDKDVVIVQDNDPAGEHRTQIISWSLKDVAKSISVIAIKGKKGSDLTDQLVVMKSQSTAMSVKWIRDNIKRIRKEDLVKPAKDYEALNDAKTANKNPFCNYTIQESKDKKGNTIYTEIPRAIKFLLEEIHTRFLGFPRRVGISTLFDFNIDKGSIELISNSTQLFSWIQRKSKNVVNWSRKMGSVNQAELFEALMCESKEYQSISHVPEYPKRNDVYYTHEDIPKADKDHKYFNGFIDLFNNLATDIDRVLLKAFCLSPLWYIKDEEKPLWIFDSKDAQASGKTKLVSFIASLYGTNTDPGKPATVSPTELKNKPEELMKRLLSDSGRNTRFLLVDNVEGVFKSPILSSMTTASYLTGRVAYGRGEETRMNNLTYVITSNNATVDTDLSSRGYYLTCKRPEANPNFGRNVNRYMENNRLNIFADMMDIMRYSETYPDVKTSTRCSSFEEGVLQKACNSFSEYNDVIKHLLDKKSETNIEEDEAKEINDVIIQNLKAIEGIDLNKPVFIRSKVITAWGCEAVSESSARNIMSFIRTLAIQKLLPNIDPIIKRYPNNNTRSHTKRTGVMFNRGNSFSALNVQYIGMRNKKVIKVYNDNDTEIVGFDSAEKDNY